MQEAFDAQGDVYIADAGNNRIQEIAAYTHTQYGITMTAGDVYTVAGQANGQAGLPVRRRPGHPGLPGRPDRHRHRRRRGPVHRRHRQQPDPGSPRRRRHPVGPVDDRRGHVHHRRQRHGAAGYTGDGGPAASALLNHPQGLAVDPAGDMYIADAGNNRIQEIAAAGGHHWGQSMTAGDIYTIAGSATGAAGSTGDGGPASSALLNGPGGLALDAAGDLYIADSGNNRVQEIAAATGTQYGQSMTTGDIYTIAGGTAPAGTPATAAPPPRRPAARPGRASPSTPRGPVRRRLGNNRIQEIAAASGTQWGQSMTAGDIYTVAGSATGAVGERRRRRPRHRRADDHHRKRLPGPRRRPVHHRQLQRHRPRSRLRHRRRHPPGARPDQRPGHRPGRDRTRRDHHHPARRRAGHLLAPSRRHLHRPVRHRRAATAPCPRMSAPP